MPALFISWLAAATNAPSGVAPGTAPMRDIHDIEGPIFGLDPLVWLLLAIAILFLAAVVTGIVLWIKWRPAPPLARLEATTLLRLQQARDLISGDDPEPYAVAVSAIVRSYLEQRFAEPSTRETTWEFLSRLEQTATLSLAGQRVPLNDFLQACDLVKFARHRPGAADLEQVHATAVRIVQATEVPAGTGAVLPVTG